MSITTHQAPSTLERGIRELLFVIRPPQHILSDVSVLKDDVHYLVGRALPDRYTPAYISLFRYSDNEDRMHHMIRFAEARAAELEPFNVFLKDFGVFFNGALRTIYLDIVNKAPVQELFEKIVRDDPDFIPHIPIARNINNQDFLRCWPYLKGLRYSNQYFHCDRITVLARRERKWEFYKEILLKDPN